MDRLRKTIIILVYALFLTAPFVLYRYFPASRVFQNYYIQVFAISISILSFFYLALSKKRINLSLLDIAILIYLITILLSSINSQDYLYTLKELLFPISGILIYFIITRIFVETQYFASLRLIKKLYVILIIGATLTSIYGMLQYFNIDFIKWEKSHLRGKFFIIAMLSHPNFVAIYIGPIIPFIIYFLFKARHISLKIILGLALLLNIICLKFTGARGTWVGVFVALAISLFLLYLNIRDRRYMSVPNIKRGFLIVLIVVIVTSLFVFRHKRFTVAERVGDVSTVMTRLYAWVLATEMINDKPLLGIGYGNYKVKYFDYVDKTQKDERYKNYKQLLEYSQARMSARTHNDYLQTAAELGIIGLCAFLFILVIIICELLRLIRSCKNTDWKFLAIVQFASIVVILTDAFFNFPLLLPNTIILFWGVVASSQVLKMMNQSGIENHTYKNMGRIYASSTYYKEIFIRLGLVLSRFTFIILIFLGLFILFVVWGMFLSMHYYYLAEGMDENSLAGKKVYATKSISYDSTNGASYMILGTVLMKEGNYLDALSKTTRAKLSYNIVNLFKQFSLVYQKLGDFQSAIDYFKTALRVYPADIDAILGLGSVYYFIGDYKQAVEVFEKGFYYNPFNEDLYLAISEAYVKLGELDKAISKLRSVLLMSPNNTKASENLAKIYIDKGIYLDEAITILQGVIKTKTDARNYASLAMAFYKKGDWVNAIRNVKRAASLAPNDKKIAEYEKFLLMKYEEKNKIIDNSRQKPDNKF